MRGAGKRCYQASCAGCPDLPSDGESKPRLGDRGLTNRARSVHLKPTCQGIKQPYPTLRCHTSAPTQSSCNLLPVWAAAILQDNFSRNGRLSVNLQQHISANHPSGTFLFCRVLFLALSHDSTLAKHSYEVQDGSIPNTMFSAAVNDVTSMKSWCTKPIPSAIASLGGLVRTGFPFTKI